MNDNSNTIVGGHAPGRNELCPCGSGLKFKHCHGDDKKRQAIQKFATALMGQLIRKEQMQKGLLPYPFTCNTCGKEFERPEESSVAPGILMCPYCNGVDIKQNEPANTQDETTTIGGDS